MAKRVREGVGEWLRGNAAGGCVAGVVRHDATRGSYQPDTDRCSQSWSLQVRPLLLLQSSATSDRFSSLTFPLASSDFSPFCVLGFLFSLRGVSQYSQKISLDSLLLNPFLKFLTYGLCTSLFSFHCA